MNDQFSKKIPIDIILQGRKLDEVYAAYMAFFERAKEVAAAERPKKSEDEIFVNAMMGATYGLYLLGVEDGMKAVSEKGG